jgi:hypothetical protein
MLMPKAQGNRFVLAREWANPLPLGHYYPFPSQSQPAAQAQRGTVIPMKEYGTKAILAFGLHAHLLTFWVPTLATGLSTVNTLMTLGSCCLRMEECSSVISSLPTHSFKLHCFHIHSWLRVWLALNFFLFVGYFGFCLLKQQRRAGDRNRV